MGLTFAGASFSGLAPSEVIFFFSAAVKRKCPQVDQVTLQHPSPPSFLPSFLPHTLACSLSLCARPKYQHREIPTPVAGLRQKFTFSQLNSLSSVEWSFLSPELSAPPYPFYRLNSEPGFRVANFLLSGQLTPLQMHPSCRHRDPGLV